MYSLCVCDRHKFHATGSLGPSPTPRAISMSCCHAVVARVKGNPPACARHSIAVLCGDLKATFGTDLVWCSKSKQCTVSRGYDYMPVSRGHVRAQYPLLMAPACADNVHGHTTRGGDSATFGDVFAEPGRCAWEGLWYESGAVRDRRGIGDGARISAPTRIGDPRGGARACR